MVSGIMIYTDDALMGIAVKPLTTGDTAPSVSIIGAGKRTQHEPAEKNLSAYQVNRS